MIEDKKIYFSIIIPTFNSAATLQKCLDSVIQQTYTNFEILIIDGVSTDNTLEIARQFNDNRIKIISEPDQGIYDAMNKGIIMAKGEWLYFLGSDDEINSKSVFSNISAFDLNNVHVIYGNVEFPGKIIYDGQFNFEKILEKNICHQAIIYHYSIFKKLGMYNLKYKIAADYAFNLKWFFNDNIKNVYISIIIANYSLNGISSIHRDVQFEKDFNEIIIHYGWRKLTKIKIKEFAHRAAVNAKAEFKQISYLYFISIYYMFRISDLLSRFFKRVFRL